MRPILRHIRIDRIVPILRHDPKHPTLRIRMSHPTDPPDPIHLIHRILRHIGWIGIVRFYWTCRHIW